MPKETQPKKSVEQTFLEENGFSETSALNYFENLFEYFHIETLSSFVKYLEKEGHITLTGTYKP